MSRRSGSARRKKKSDPPRTIVPPSDGDVGPLPPLAAVAGGSLAPARPPPLPPPPVLTHQQYEPGNHTYNHIDHSQHQFRRPFPPLPPQQIAQPSHWGTFPALPLQSPPLPPPHQQQYSPAASQYQQHQYPFYQIPPPQQQQQQHFQLPTQAQPQPPQPQLHQYLGRPYHLPPQHHNAQHQQPIYHYHGVGLGTGPEPSHGGASDETQYELRIIQQPVRARMSGFGNSDRRPVDPSPILQLITYGPRGPVQIGPDEAAKLVVHASLWSADGLEDRNVVVSPYYYVSRHDRSREDGHNSDEKDERDGDVDGGDEDGRAAGHVDGMEDGDGDVDGHGSPDDHQQHAHHDHHPHYHQHRHGGRPDAPLPPPAATTARSTLGSAGAAVNADDRNVTLQIHPPDSTGNLSTTTPSTTAPSSPSLSATTTTTTPSPTSSLDTDSDNSNESTADGKSSSCTRRRDMIQTLVGSVVSQCTPLKDLEGRMGLFAIFHDLSIRTPGQYRIRFSLLRLFPNIPSPTTTPIITSVLSDIVDVFQPKRFPGLLVTTRLSQHFANQGVPIHVRKSAPQNSRAKKELQE